MKKQNVYQEIAQKLLHRIEVDEYNLTQKLPSEYDLAKDFQVSRLTVRRAIDELVKLQIVMKVKGKGTYILTKPEKIQSGSFGLQSFSEAAKKRGLFPETKVITFQSRQQPTREMRLTLQLEEGEEIYIIKRLRLANHEPMVLEEICLPMKFIPALTIDIIQKQSIFSLIEQYLEIGYSHQEIGAVAISKEESDLLQIPEHSPALLVHSTTYSLTGMPILIDNSYYRADKYTFTNVLTRN